MIEQLEISKSDAYFTQWGIYFVRMFLKENEVSSTINKKKQDVTCVLAKVVVKYPFRLIIT